jgi:hypothetical protein
MPDPTFKVQSILRGILVFSLVAFLAGIMRGILLASVLGCTGILAIAVILVFNREIRDTDIKRRTSKFWPVGQASIEYNKIFSHRLVYIYAANVALCAIGIWLKRPAIQIAVSAFVSAGVLLVLCRTLAQKMCITNTGVYTPSQSRVRYYLNLIVLAIIYVLASIVCVLPSPSQ